MTPPRQHLEPTRTTWHITFGTYGTRLHGAAAPTVDRNHNQLGSPLLDPCDWRWEADRKRMNFEPRYLTSEQRVLIEASLPDICERGGWSYRTAAAQQDHVHLLVDVETAVHGEKVRRLVKRWLTQSLNPRWPLPKGAVWWAEQGSNIAVKEEAYLNRAYRYVLRQRATAAPDEA
ncbi:hypothetical protein Pla175_07020 [Pirellulimonas nuda]|uniref:Transposase IS200 like protein n=1 Tax=Pirellulimonas nuda TaxID=2528009 RepID=A0A518D783_9BACT|nr:transposase [Pirellulimonas nuda]QDU87343.1 hypothetical protein Pla175_07020 [Pirellulimonas nuda]